MRSEEYLTLRLVRLKSREQWTCPGQGLSFIFPQGGEGQYLSPSGSYSVTGGDVLVLNAASGGSLSVPAGNGIVFWSFSLCFEHLFPLFFSEEISLLQQVSDGLKGARYYPASAPLAAECHRLLGAVPAQFNLDHRSHLLRVVAAILSVEFKSARGQRVGFIQIEDHMTQVFEKLSSADLLNLSVGELAERFSCSRRHLNRLFHQHFGFSVIGLRMEMRLVKALALLRNPHAKIISVAEDCGFNHLGLFNTCFKKRFGTSPGEWRKNELRTAGQADSRSKSDSNFLGTQGSSGRAKLDKVVPEGRHLVLVPNQVDKRLSANLSSPALKGLVPQSRNGHAQRLRDL